MNQTPNLRSLSPHYVEKQHGQYVQILVAELQKNTPDAPRNIALTGHYGSGKSSVLVETQRRLKEANVEVINLSLPSLGIGEARLKTAGQVSLDTTNLIQKEIVKQLLYRLKPSDTPASRYNRLDTFQRLPAFRRAAAVGAALAGLALLIGVPAKFRSSLPVSFWSHLNRYVFASSAVTLQWLSLLAVFALGLGASYWVQRVLQQRIRLTELAAGPAKVTLSDKSTSFFDEYLDEIVYFFQNSKTKIAIFEDLDRFQDPHIFETLRELNLLLNDAEQVGTAPIRFVYAIRDSIFEQLDTQPDIDDTMSTEARPVSVETRGLMSTNRTKFFDLVIPMVPFISHKTSRELISGELKSVEAPQRPSPEVVDLLSVHLTDMRLIKNICNEYDVFRSYVLGKDALDGLTPDRLFASIVYKNVYLADYERIRSGTSLLDSMYEAYREWVTQQAAAARNTERVAEIRLQRIAIDAIAGRSKRLGERLQAVLAAGSSSLLEPQYAQVVHAGTAYGWSQLLTTDFWSSYLKSPQDLSIFYRQQYYGTGGTFSPGDVQVLMNEQFSASDWETHDRAEWRKKMTAAAVDHQVVTQASLAVALGYTDKEFLYDDEDLSLVDVADKLFIGANVVVDLLKAGFIDENFTLYVTQFPGQGSASAMNFILKAVQPNVADTEYRFRKDGKVDTSAIQSVVQSEGRRLFEGRSVYNLEIFDYLLSTEPSKLDQPIRRLSLSEDEHSDFVKAYVRSGARATDFVERLSRYWRGIFAFLLGEETGGRSLPLLSAALIGANADSAYELSDEQRDELAATLSELDALTSVRLPKEAASIARLLAGMGIKVSNLSVVAQPLKDELVARDSYIISRQNLEAILGSDGGLSLDVILDSELEEVFKYVLEHVEVYLAALEAPPLLPAVATAEQFASVLSAVAAVKPEALQKVAERAGVDCMIDDLSVIEEVHWPALARAHRMRLTSDNVTKYLTKVGLDDAIADWLSAAGEIEVAGGDALVASLSVQFLNSALLTDGAKLSLVRSMHLAPASIMVSSLEDSAHSLIADLVGEGWIEDNATAFTSLGKDEWPFKQSLICASTAFPDYMPTLTLSGNDLLKIASAPVPDAVKEVLITQYATFEGALGKNGARELAQWASDKGLQPTSGVLVSLAAKAGMPGAHPIISLLGAQASSIELEALKQSLQSLGGMYGQLTVPGRDRPDPPRVEGMASILARLKDAGIVSKYSDHPRKPTYLVFKRHS